MRCTFYTKLVTMVPAPSDLLALSTDVVLFSIHTERLEVLLIEQGDGHWRLPGGAVGAAEDLDGAARRHLREQTAVADVYLEQLYTFGDPGRVACQRVVSVAYYALVPAERPPLQAPGGNPPVDWRPVNALPPLILDHACIVALAHQRLASKLAYSTIALQFMPTSFTLSALQTVYETILGEPLDKRNFRKRILAMSCIEATGAMTREGNHRPARLYRATHPRRIEFLK